MTTPQSRNSASGPTRRAFLSTTGLAIATASLRPDRAAADPKAPFTYEVQRSEDASRAMLSDEEHHILREGGTECPASSPLWTEARDGTYDCKGCDLLVYRAPWKEQAVTNALEAEGFDASNVSSLSLNEIAKIKGTLDSGMTATNRSKIEKLLAE